LAFREPPSGDIKDRQGSGQATMKWLKKLGNPLLLVAQGFAAGAILVFATADDSRPDRSPADAEAVARILNS
jgi:hypothetical protein